MTYEHRRCALTAVVEVANRRCHMLVEIIRASRKIVCNKATQVRLLKRASLSLNEIPFFSRTKNPLLSAAAY